MNQRRTVVMLLCACFLFALLSALQIVIGNEYAAPDINGRGGHSWGSDDAFITYRYSQNLWHGYGWVFNPGEKPVEGCSTLLYALCMAPIAGLTNGIKVYFLSALLNLVFSLTALVVFFRFVRSELGHNAATVALFLGALCPALWVWTASGMETTLVFLLQICAWGLVEKVARQNQPQTEHTLTGKKYLFWLCLVLGLTVLARADGFIFAALVALYLFLKEGSRRSALISGISGTTVFLVTAANVVGRLAYYGYPLPNTYYAKVSGPLTQRLGTGFLQLCSLIGEAPALGVAILAVGAAFVLASPRFTARPAQSEQNVSLHNSKPLRFEMLFLPLWLLYWVYVGGDHFGDRFLLPLYFVGIFTMLRLLSFEASERSAQKPLRLAVAAVIALFAIVELGVVNHEPMFAYRRPKYDCWITLGRFLKQQYPVNSASGRKTTLAIDAAGKIPFITGLPTVDMLDLNDAVLGHKPATTFRAGHNKFDPDYVLSRKPDIVCAWLTPNLDRGWGLERAKYETAGYRLRYMTNSTLYSQAPNLDVIDVGSASESDKKALFGHGFLLRRLGTQRAFETLTISTKFRAC